MKNIIPAALVGAILGALVTGLILHHKKETPEGGEAHDEKHHEESRVSRAADGSVILKLPIEQQTNAGLQVATVVVTNLAPRGRAWGRVLDPAPLALQLAELAAARAALTASAREYERAKKLFELGQNSSARALETAEATWRRDEVLLESARSKLLITWGPAIAGRTNLEVFVRSLTSLQSAVARLDMPLGQPLPPSPAGIEVSLLGTEEAWSPAESLGSAPTVDPLTQGEGILCWIKSGAFKPGAPVTAFITGPGASQSGLVVPRTALVRHTGLVFVYQQTGPEEFTRRPVMLEQPLATGWFIRNGVKAGDALVVSGAQSLLSEELKGQGEEE
jgi:hypothetical protein